MTFEQGELILYQSDDGQTTVDVQLQNETVWLSQAQMVELFQKTKQNVSLHTRNIFREGELEEAVVKESLTTGSDGKRSSATPNSVFGPLIFSKIAVKGYTLNQNRLAEKGLNGVQ